MNNFVHAYNGFHTNEFYYGDTDSLHIIINHGDKLDKAGLVGKGSLQGKKDYKDLGIFRWISYSNKDKVLFNYK